VWDLSLFYAVPVDSKLHLSDHYSRKSLQGLQCELPGLQDEPPKLQSEPLVLKDFRTQREPLWLHGFRLSFHISMMNPRSIRVILQGLLVSIDGCFESLDGSMVSVSGSRMINQWL
jgi:hypothetical protein